MLCDPLPSPPPSRTMPTNSCRDSAGLIDRLGPEEVLGGGGGGKGGRGVVVVVVTMVNGYEPAELVEMVGWMNNCIRTIS